MDLSVYFNGEFYMILSVERYRAFLDFLQEEGYRVIDEEWTDQRVYLTCVRETSVEIAPDGTPETQ